MDLVCRLVISTAYDKTTKSLTMIGTKCFDLANNKTRFSKRLASRLELDAAICSRGSMFLRADFQIRIASGFCRRSVYPIDLHRPNSILPELINKVATRFTLMSQLAKLCYRCQLAKMKKQLPMPQFHPEWNLTPPLSRQPIDPRFDIEFKKVLCDG